MLHNLDMPSFVSDDSGNILSLQRPSEPLGELRQSREKTNGNTRSPYQKSVKGSLENGLDQGSDKPYGAGPILNGEMPNNGELSSILNGRSSEASWENKSSRNDSAMSVNGTINGVMENGMKSTTSQNGLPKVSSDRNSVASVNGGAVQARPSAETSVKANSNSESNGPPKRTAPLPPVSTNPHSTGPLTYNSSLLPATPTPDTPARSPTTSPHRFSSPPAYPAPNLPIPSGSTTNSLQHPGSQQLKHRHTLQVPKPGPSRGSKDGEDGVFTSGRFSPTTATGGRRNSLSLIRRNTRSIHSDMPHEEIPQDEDAMRWAEAIRQRRASKRKRKDEEDDDRVVVGTKVDQNHVNWVTAYNMLTGIRFTVSRTNAKLDRPLTDMDFEQKHKFSFDM
jgi:1-phosphatidylinositol-4-phosphate 5-kinase